MCTEMYLFIAIISEMLIDMKLSHKAHIYCISSVIRVYSFQNNCKDLDPSFKMDLDLMDCLGRVKLVLSQNFIALI